MYFRYTYVQILYKISPLIPPSSGQLPQVVSYLIFSSQHFLKLLRFLLRDLIFNTILFIQHHPWKAMNLSASVRRSGYSYGESGAPLKWDSVLLVVFLLLVCENAILTTCELEINISLCPNGIQTQIGSLQVRTKELCQWWKENYFLWWKKTKEMVGPECGETWKRRDMSPRLTSKSSWKAVPKVPWPTYDLSHHCWHLNNLCVTLKDQLFDFLWSLPPTKLCKTFDHWILKCWLLCWLLWWQQPVFVLCLSVCCKPVWPFTASWWCVKVLLISHVIWILKCFWSRHICCYENLFLVRSVRQTDRQRHPEMYICHLCFGTFELLFLFDQ